jgi:hypothetical protein
LEEYVEMEQRLDHGEQEYVAMLKISFTKCKKWVEFRKCKKWVEVKAMVRREVPKIQEGGGGQSNGNGRG